MKSVQSVSPTPALETANAPVPVDVEKLKAAMERVREAVKKDDHDEMKSASEALTQAWHAVSSELYAQAGPKGRPEGAQGGPQTVDDEDRGEQGTGDAAQHPPCLPHERPPGECQLPDGDERTWRMREWSWRGRC